MFNLPLEIDPDIDCGHHGQSPGLDNRHTSCTTTPTIHSELGKLFRYCSRISMQGYSIEDELTNNGWQGSQLESRSRRTPQGHHGDRERRRRRRSLGFLSAIVCSASTYSEGRIRTEVHLAHLIARPTSSQGGREGGDDKGQRCRRRVFVDEMR